MTTNENKDFPLFIQLTGSYMISAKTAEELFLWCDSVERIKAELDMCILDNYQDFSADQTDRDTAAEKIFKRLQPKRLKLEEKRKIQEEKDKAKTLAAKQKQYLKLKKELGYKN